MDGVCERCGYIGKVVRAVRPVAPEDVRLFCLRCVVLVGTGREMPSEVFEEVKEDGAG